MDNEKNMQINKPKTDFNKLREDLFNTRQAAQEGASFTVRGKEVTAEEMLLRSNKILDILKDFKSEEAQEFQKEMETKSVLGAVMKYISTEMGFNTNEYKKYDQMHEKAAEEMVTEIKQDAKTADSVELFKADMAIPDNVNSLEHISVEETKKLLIQDTEKIKDMLSQCDIDNETEKELIKAVQNITDSLNRLDKIDKRSIKGLVEGGQEFKDKVDDTLSKTIAPDNFDKDNIINKSQKEINKKVKEIKSGSDLVKYSAINATQEISSGLANRIALGTDTFWANRFLKRSYQKENRHNMLILKHEANVLNKIVLQKKKMEKKLQKIQDKVKKNEKRLSLNPFRSLTKKKLKQINIDISVLNDTIQFLKEDLKGNYDIYNKRIDEQIDVFNKLSKERSAAGMSVNLKLENTKREINSQKNVREIDASLKSADIGER